MYGARIGYLILATAQNTLLGAVLGLSERAFYASYAAAPRLLADWTPLDDQAFGGGVMWSGSHMFLLAILILLHRAMDAEGRKAECTRPPHRVGFAQSMLDIGIQELLVIMVLALLIFGPDKLPGSRASPRPGDARVPPRERRVPLDGRAEPPDPRGPRHLPSSPSPLEPQAATPVASAASGSDSVADGSSTEGTASGQRVEPDRDRGQAEDDLLEPYWTSRGGRLLHRRECAWRGRVPVSERIPIKAALDGWEQGLKPCPVCDPEGSGRRLLTPSFLVDCLNGC